MREFEGGATRSDDTEKLQYARFFSALVLKRRAEYMNKHRKQEDGKLREPDNWKNGIPVTSCVDSLARHMQDILLWNDGYEAVMVEDIQDSLCAVMFNCESILLTLLNKK